MKPAPDIPRWAQALRMLGHPALALPLAIPVARYFGRYSPAEVTELQRVPLFLQGSTDWGGACLFAGTLALYVLFGLTVFLYLTVELAGRASLRRALWVLRFHILLFLAGGTFCLGYDERITPNDFRNLFLWAGLLYGASTLWVVYLARTRLHLGARLALAPAFVAAWLWLGADGNTAKAGQVVQSGQDPVESPRSARHAVLLGWHRGCDRLLGDLAEQDGDEPSESILYRVPAWSMLLLGLAVLDAMGRQLNRRAGVRPVRFWLATTFVLGFAAASLYARQLAQIGPVLKRVAAAEARLAGALDARDLAALRADRAWTESAGNRLGEEGLSEASREILRRIESGIAGEESEGLRIQLLLPLDGPHFAYLAGGPSFRYADRRRLRTGNTRLGDYDVVRFMETRQRDYRPSFLSLVGDGWCGLFARDEVVVGRRLPFEGGVAMLLVSEDR